MGAPRVDLGGNHFLASFWTFVRTQKRGFPPKSTLGAPTTSLSKQFMNTWMAAYA